MSEQHIGSWTRCPGCGVGTELDAIGAARFAVGHFNCSSCQHRWEECRATACFGYDPACPCAETGGYRPYLTVSERLGLSAAGTGDVGAMSSGTRIVHFSVDPALRAYLAWLEEDTGRVFDRDAYDLFAAGYRANVEGAAAPMVLEALQAEEVAQAAWENCAVSGRSVDAYTRGLCEHADRLRRAALAASAPPSTADASSEDGA